MTPPALRASRGCYSVTEQVAEQARFAARAFVARWSSETGEELPAVVTDRMLFAYEMGYLRGHGKGMGGSTLAGSGRLTSPGQSDEQADLAARAFVDLWSSETGGEPAVITDRMLFAYEMGYLRGHGKGLRVSIDLYDELRRNDAGHGYE